MFGSWRKKHPLVYSHWYVLLPNFQSSASELYDEVLEELEDRKVPGLDAKPVNFFEGGIFSRKRRYLRMIRERLVFDVCSAPFGSAWFFSCRIGAIPFTLRFWEFLLIAAVLLGIFFLYPFLFGPLWGPFVYGASIISALVLLNTFATTASHNLDAILLKIPVIGSLYELFVRRNQTYYREDTRAMYVHIVDEVVRDKVIEAAAQGGVEEVEFHRIDDPVSPPRYHEKLRALWGDGAGAPPVVGR